MSFLARIGLGLVGERDEEVLYSCDVKDTIEFKKIGNFRVVMK